MGRVFREPAQPLRAGQGLLYHVRVIWRLMRAWGVENAKIQARFGGATTIICTDRDGYFRLDLALTEPPPPGRLWHQVSLRLIEPVIPGLQSDVPGDVFIPETTGPKTTCSLAVISDIDDTVMETGVANKLMMMWRLFATDSDGRTAFPGMASFLQALHRGACGHDTNPMLYVSRAPWALYGVLDRFFNHHDIPIGPILFLRDWGMTLQHPLPRRSKGHKINLIRQIIAHYDDLPFVLIGDSGQRDPEVYADIVRQFPHRIRAVYIHDVNDDRQRRLTISEMAPEFKANGTGLVLATDALAMAQHAAEHGLIAETALTAIDAEMASTPWPMTPIRRSASGRP